MRDKLLIGVVRGAYADYLPRDRHPLVALFVTLPPREVDVNVHPAKTEVRFRDAALVRALLMHALKEALARDGQRAASTGGTRDHRGVPAGGAAAPRRLRLAHLAVAAASAAQAPWRRGCAPETGFAEAPQAAFDVGGRRRYRPRRDRRARARRCSTGRSAPPAPRCTTPTSWRRPATAW